MESSPESTITQAFNPFIATQAIWGMGADGLIYEPLLQFDIAAPPKYYPWLATAYTVVERRQGGHLHDPAGREVQQRHADDARRRRVHLQPGQEERVASTSAGWPISSVSTSGNTVTLTFPTAQYTNLQEIAGVPILPQSIWSKVGNPATYADPNPVGTGPYKLKTFTPQGFTLTKNAGYWQASMAKVHQRLLPGLHLQHRRAVGAVRRADRLDRQLHPRPAEGLRRQGTRPTTTSGRRRAARTPSSPT